MARAAQVGTPEPPLDAIALLADRAQRMKFFGCHRKLRSPATVTRLYDECIRLLRVDLRRAERLGEAAAFLARDLADESLVARTERALAHVQSLRGDYPAALQHYEQSLTIFKRAHADLEWALTVSGLLQTLIYLGMYDRALRLAPEAREIFTRQHDHLRLARLDSNLGNVFYRQDRFAEALDLYQRAHAAFVSYGDPSDVTIALRNMAVCHISLNRFEEALDTYRRARRYAEQHGLPVLVAESDYNIAYLYYLRGEYTVAIGLYEDTRELCSRLGDPYHRALCDLDQAEMYLELNLSEGGADLAQRAFRGFRDLKMNYEAAKALTFLAIAASHQGRTERALTAFDEARALFIREKNEVWPALIYLYKALVLFENGEIAEAERLARSALAFFDDSPLTGKAAICELLLARIHLQRHEPGEAVGCCQVALQRIASGDFPAVGYQAQFVLALAREAEGNTVDALRAYTRAHEILEGLRSHLNGEELKIAFLKNKLAVYENLVTLTLHLDAADGTAKAFDLIERAKSRSLADLIAFRAQRLRPRSGGSSALADCIRELRDRLNWAHHQIEVEGLRLESGAQHRMSRLRRQTRDLENELVKLLGNARTADREFVEVQSAASIGLDAIRQSLPADAMIVEYYQARGRLFVCLLTGKDLEIVELGAAAEARDSLRLLQFQLSKFRFRSDYTTTFAEPLLRATEAHLRRLYDILIRPVHRSLSTGHLVVIPHGFLHYLPFHALHDGTEYLGDNYTISYAPSGSIFALCEAKQTSAGNESLVLGVPDPRAPFIEDEARRVAERLPAARVFLGDDATEECLTEFGPFSRFLHIATHGLFRSDSPMFSSIRLGRSQLSLYDLYQLQLSCELVTLSGCGTGLNVVVGGDELLGLVRGLLYAGSQAVMVTLWDVHDESTAQFMTSFYSLLQSHTDKAAAVQQAMRELRRSHPHPYYWAPFVLIGKYR